MNTFNSQSTLKVGNTEFDYFSLEQAEKAGAGNISKLPFSFRVMLENLLRFEDGATVTAADIRALGAGAPAKQLHSAARNIMQLCDTEREPRPPPRRSKITHPLS